MQQAHVYYSGQVQGVGFRFTVQRYATDYKLTGWVKNLPDGRVEALLEGDEQSIRLLLETIEKHFSQYISKKEVALEEAQHKFDDFRITH